MTSKRPFGVQLVVKDVVLILLFQFFPLDGAPLTIYTGKNIYNSQLDSCLTLLKDGNPLIISGAISHPTVFFVFHTLPILKIRFILLPLLRGHCFFCFLFTCNTAAIFPQQLTLSFVTQRSLDMQHQINYRYFRVKAPMRATSQNL